MCLNNKMEKKFLTISSWNIHGYISGGFNKFDDPNFINSVNDCDIICLMETHCDLEQCLEISGFKTIHLIRPKTKKI